MAFNFGFGGGWPAAGGRGMPSWGGAAQGGGGWAAPAFLQRLGQKLAALRQGGGGWPQLGAGRTSPGLPTWNPPGGSGAGAGSSFAPGWAQNLVLAPQGGWNPNNPAPNGTSAAYAAQQGGMTGNRAFDEAVAKNRATNSALTPNAAQNAQNIARNNALNQANAADQQANAADNAQRDEHIRRQRGR